MLAVISVASLAGGTFMAYFAERLPLRRASAELVAGLLLVFGLAVIGFGLSPLFR